MDGLIAPKQLDDLKESIACTILMDYGTNLVWDIMKPLLLPIAHCPLLNVITINKIDNTNDNISKGEHHYAQYQYEVQLPRGVVV